MSSGEKPARYTNREVFLVFGAILLVLASLLVIATISEVYYPYLGGLVILSNMLVQPIALIVAVLSIIKTTSTKRRILLLIYCAGILAFLGMCVYFFLYPVV